jgi:hypothetical protein
MNQMMGFHAMLDEHLEVPFKTEFLRGNLYRRVNVGRFDSAEEFGRVRSERESAADRSSKVKASARRRGAAILSVSTPRCAVCEAGRVSLAGRQRTYPLARFKSALFTTKPAPAAFSVSYLCGPPRRIGVGAPALGAPASDRSFTTPLHSKEYRMIRNAPAGEGYELIVTKLLCN